MEKRYYSIAICTGWTNIKAWGSVGFIFFSIFVLPWEKVSHYRCKIPLSQLLLVANKIHSHIFPDYFDEIFVLINLLSVFFTVPILPWTLGLDGCKWRVFLSISTCISNCPETHRPCGLSGGFFALFPTFSEMSHHSIQQVSEGEYFA